MSNLSSGAGVNTTNNNTSSFLSNVSSHRSSFRTVQKPSSFNPLSPEEVGFIDENVDEQAQDQQQQIVYNSPWDFKIKLQTNQSSNSISRLSIVQPSPAPRIIPPAVPTSQPPSISQSVKTINTSGSQSSLTSSATAVPADQDESQYCAPWDLKIQEELLKKMAESSTTSNGTKSNTLNNGTNSLKTDNMTSTNNSNCGSSGSFQRDHPANQSIKSTKSVNEILSNTNTSNQNGSNNMSTNRNNNIVDNSESNEYNPPWELKQSILMQSLTSGGKQGTHPSQQHINNRAQLTNTSSSSSTRSSTSSLSTNSPPSMPPPLPPSVPPPPLPTSTLNQETKRCFHHQTSQQQLAQNNQQIPQPSPSLSHKHLSRNFTTGFLPTSSALNSNNSSIFLPIANTPVSNASSVTNTSANTSTVLMTNSNYLNDKPSIICAWNTNSFDANTANRFVTNTSNSHLIHLQQTHNHSLHHHHNCQTVSSVNNVESCVQAVPLTALVAFPSNSTTSTSSLAANLMTLNIQQQAQGALVLPQLPSPSHQSTLERQMYLTFFCYLLFNVILARFYSYSSKMVSWTNHAQTCRRDSEQQTCG